MQDLITFFKNRENCDKTYQIFNVFEGQSHCVYVYSKQALPDYLTGDENANFEILIDQIEICVREKGVGMVVVATESSPGKNYIYPVYANGQNEISVLKVNSTGSNYQKLKLRQQEVIVDEHIIIPVEKDAEKYLKTFTESLTYLPKDMEILLLTTLAEPTHKFKQKKMIGLTLLNYLFTSFRQVVRHLSRIKHSLNAVMRKPGGRHAWSRMATMVIFIGLIVAATTQLNMFRDNSRALSSEQSQANILYTHRSPLSKTSSVTTEPEIDSIVRDILEFISKPSVHSIDESMQLLWSVYFSKSIDNEYLGSSLIHSGLGVDSTAEMFYSGVLKMVTMTAGVHIAEIKFLTDGKEWSQTKNVIRQNKIMDKLDRERRQLMAMLACRIFDLPGIVQTEQGRNPELWFTENRTCRSFSKHQAIAGLRKLQLAVANYVIQKP